MEKLRVWHNHNVYPSHGDALIEALFECFEQIESFNESGAAVPGDATLRRLVNETGYYIYYDLLHDEVVIFAITKHGTLTID